MIGRVEVRRALIGALLVLAAGSCTGCTDGQDPAAPESRSSVDTRTCPQPVNPPVPTLHVCLTIEGRR